MDRRTLYLQQLLQVSDQLVQQRNMMMGLGSLVMSLFGSSTIATTIPPGTAATPGTNLRVVVPPLAIYQLAAGDTAWPDASGPGSPISLLSALSTQTMIQGLSLASSTIAITTTPDSALSIGGGNSQYFLIEGKLQYPVDQNLQVLPYQSLLQTTAASATNTTNATLTLAAGGTKGMSVGDAILVAGFPKSDGTPFIISSINTGTDTLTFTGQVFTSITNINGAVVRDVNPNAGNPLNGPGNTGIAQPVDRVATVALKVVAGVAAASPTKPATDAGFIPLFMVGPLANGATTISGGSIVIATNNSNVQTAPFFPTLVGAAHHKGIAGQASKLVLAQESDLPLSFGATIQYLSAIVSRVLTGSYAGNGASARAINIAPSFAPTFVINVGNFPDDGLYLYHGATTVSGFVVSGAGPDLFGNTRTDSAFGGLSGTGFVTGTIASRSGQNFAGNVNGITYRWVAWG